MFVAIEYELQFAQFVGTTLINKMKEIKEIKEIKDSTFKIRMSKGPVRADPLAL